MVWVVEVDELASIALPRSAAALAVAGAAVACSNSDSTAATIAASVTASLAAAVASCIIVIASGIAVVTTGIAIERTGITTGVTTVEVFVLLGVPGDFVGAVAAVFEALAGEGFPFSHALSPLGRGRCGSSCG